MAAPLQRRIAALQSLYPGVAAEALGSEWRIRIPEPLRIGHDAAFAEFTRRFLADVADPASRSARERPKFKQREIYRRLMCLDMPRIGLT